MKSKKFIKATIYKPLRNPRMLAGAALILLGVIVLLSQYLQTAWLPLVIVPATGLVLLGESIRSHKLGLMIAGCLLGGLGAGGLLAVSPVARGSLPVRLGTFLAAFAAGWLLISLLARFMWKRNFWWALVPMGAFGGASFAFLFTRLGLVDFVLGLSMGVGLAFLVWGMLGRLFGLIIPGCLLIGIGPGIFAAWSPWETPNPLAQTGTMLVWFAFGWVLITLVTRVTFAKFVWWSLIPAGVLAMVGIGLYIGGNPGDALNLISNTGSVALIVFGLYLILMRRGIQS